MESTKSESSFSTSRQKQAFMRSWYPNGVPVGSRVAESMSLARMLPRNIECLNTDSDISELADYEHADSMPVAETKVPSYGGRSVALDGSGSLSVQGNVADWEVVAGTQLSVGIESLTMSEGRLKSQNMGTLWQQLMKERKDRQECHVLLEQLQENYDVLLQKYATAENTIDVLRIRREFVGGSVEQGVLTSQPRRRIKVREYQSREYRSSSATNGPNTNPAQKPSVISIRLRANCLKDEIDFIKMAMQEQSDCFAQKGDIVRELEDSLELLRQDYQALEPHEKDRGLETDILQLQAALRELASSLCIESRPCPVTRHRRKTNDTRGKVLQRPREIMWPPPIPSDSRVAGDVTRQQSPTSRSVVARDIIGVQQNPWVAPSHAGQVTNWSVSCFGGLKAHMCVDKKARMGFRSEQDPNFSLSRCTLLDEQHPGPTSSDNRFTDPRRCERAVPGDPTKKPCSQTLARKKQDTAIRRERRGGDLAVSADIQESKINLQSKENVAKLKMLSKLRLADKKAHDLHRKSGEILSRIYSSSNSKHAPKVYY